MTRALFQHKDCLSWYGILILKIYRIMHELPWIMIFGHEWSDLPMIFMSDEVTSENHWQITSRVTRKSLFMVTNVLFYFLQAILCSEHTNSTENNYWLFFLPSSPRMVFSVLALWHHHGWSVMSQELALWRHIRRLFLHMQVGVNAIFTRE